MVAPSNSGELVLWWFGELGMSVKTAIKAEGASHLMGGSGPNAAMVRALRWILEGDTTEERVRRLNVVHDAA
jgi:hypothetical protein